MVGHGFFDSLATPMAKVLHIANSRLLFVFSTYFSCVAFPKVVVHTCKKCVVLAR